MRRNPADVALSAYRSFFATPVPWSWSWDDIARQMEIEDDLHAHWATVFPEQILTVQYEELVGAPKEWIPRILAHVGLEEEPQVYASHERQRPVRTASVKQVRAPISTEAVGKSERYRDQMKPFFDSYTPRG